MTNRGHSSRMPYVPPRTGEGWIHLEPLQERETRESVGDIPGPLVAAMSARRRVDVFVCGRRGWVWHPARLRCAQHLGAPSYQRVYRLEEARAVGAQLLRDEVAWKVRRPRAGRCLRLFVWSG